MTEQTYWLIEIVDFTHKSRGRSIVDGHYLEYYPPSGGVAEVVFTDEQRASEYAVQVLDMEHHVWRTRAFVGDGELIAAIDSSIPRKTHVLMDPVWGDEKASLYPLERIDVVSPTEEE